MSQPICAIIGAGEGLGKALAKKFANNGFGLALISRSQVGSAAAMHAAATITSNVKFFQADAEKPETIEDALALVATTMGEIQVLIYNCRERFTACAPLDMTYDALIQNFNVEVIGALAAAKSVMPTMIQRSSGSVFFSSATAAYRGSSTHPLYTIGKFGIRALSQSLAKAYSINGVHIVHVRLDCDLDVPYMRASYEKINKKEYLASPEAVAEGYWLTHLQPKGAWSNEIELRPYRETWTY